MEKSDTNGFRDRFFRSGPDFLWFLAPFLVLQNGAPKNKISFPDTFSDFLGHWVPVLIFLVLGGVPGLILVVFLVLGGVPGPILVVFWLISGRFWSDFRRFWCRDTPSVSGTILDAPGTLPGRIREGFSATFAGFRRGAAGIHRQSPELTLRGSSGVRRSSRSDLNSPYPTGVLAC